MLALVTSLSFYKSAKVTAYCYIFKDVNRAI